MKKLFNIGSSIVVSAFSELRITGSYELLTLEPNLAIVKNGQYTVEVMGEELVVEKLGEELAVFSFEKMEKLSVIENKAEGSLYDA